MESSITKEDAVITAYRAHGWTYVRGVAPHAILGELTGRNIAVSPHEMAGKLHALKM